MCNVLKYSASQFFYIINFKMSNITFNCVHYVCFIVTEFMILQHGSAAELSFGR